MTFEEYFGDWSKVVDKTETLKIVRWLSEQTDVCPNKKDVFKAFKLCPLCDCIAVMIGMDPYSQKGAATGVLFGNSKETKVLSPSLQVIKEAVINYEKPHGPNAFDKTLESWSKQGILMLNSSLTCQTNHTGSHFNIWKEFTSKLIHNLSQYNSGLLYVLFGRQACLFKDCITSCFDIIETNHPAYYARRHEKMPYDVFTRINNSLYRQYGTRVQFFKEKIYGI